MAIRRELPEDVLVDVLRRLPPRSLATSRCVCRAWREAIDARRLLRADLLPLSVRGIFMNYCTLVQTEFFSRPTTGPAISGCLDFIIRPTTGPAISGCLDFIDHPWCSEVKDHCNGVANPATRRSARLPRFPRASIMGQSFISSVHLVFDPMVSPHYEVFLIPIFWDDYYMETELDPQMLQSEWPPSSYPLQVFSSLTGRWEERQFAREGGTIGAATGMRPPWCRGGEAVYWRGALYFYRCNDSFMSVFMANTKYKLVPMPTESLGGYIGRSEKGVYYWDGLCIFYLDESCGQSEWVLKHCVNLETFARKLFARMDENYERGIEIPGPWILQSNVNDTTTRNQAVVEEKFEWNSDDDSVLDTEDMVEGDYSGYMEFMGFHPFKEAIFLNASVKRGVAYHWATSKFQDLGNIYPKDYAESAGMASGIEKCFIYTPCWMEDFPEPKWDTDIEIE